MAANDCSYTNSASTSVNLNDGSTNTLEAPGPQGIYEVIGTPIVAGIPRKLPAGLYQVSNLKAREIEVPVLVRGATPSALATNLRTLTSALWVDVRDDELGTFKYTAPNSNERHIKAALKEAIDIKEWHLAGTSDLSAALVSIPLLCPDPTFYNPTAVTPSGAFNGTSNVNISCANAGDVDAYVTITYTGIVTHPKVTDAYGNFMYIENDTAHANDTLVLTLDPQNLSITYTPNGGSATDWFGYRSADSTMVYAKYGTNNLTFVGEDAGDDATIGISLNPRYSTHG